MLHIRTPFLVATCLASLLWAACGTPQSALPHVIAEHDRQTSQVIVSLALLTEYRQEELIEAILDAGADVIVVLPRVFTGGLQNPAFDALRARLAHVDLERIWLVHGTGDRAPSIWARDWGPLVARGAAGERPWLIDFDFDFGRDGDDDIVSAIARAANLEVRHVPLSQQHGDFMSDSRGRCFVSERIPKHHADTERSAIADVYRDALGCNEVIFTKIYLEFQTGHLDLYAKLLADDTMLLGEFTEETKAVMREQNLRPDFWEPFFEERLNEFKRLGLEKIIRVPMPFPREKRTPSYVNSLLVGKTAIVPRFNDPTEPDAHLVEGYEEAVRRAYRSAGYDVVFVDADNITTHGGAIHCVTMQASLPIFSAELRTAAADG